MEKLRRFALALLAVCILSSFAAAQTFTVTDLGSLAGGGPVDTSYGYAINSQGEVAGASYTPSITEHAFFWTQTSGMLDLGTFGGPNSMAWGINDSQQVVGQADLANGFTHAFLWTEAHGLQDLGTFAAGLSSYAFAINNAGQVVGGSFVSSTSEHAFLWTVGGGMLDLGTLGGSSSVATGINDLGQIVGNSSTSDGSTHAFFWTFQEGMQDLGSARSYDPSYALGINDSSGIVGYSGTTELFQYTYGLLWTKGRYAHQIPFVPESIQNFPMAINNQNQITGQFNDSQGFANAFLYSEADGIKNLNQSISSSSGWYLDIGTAINSSLQITGWGVNAASATHAFLLTKIP